MFANSINKTTGTEAVNKLLYTEGFFQSLANMMQNPVNDKVHQQGLNLLVRLVSCKPTELLGMNGILEFLSGLF
jgi:hypothetical protein